MFVLLQTQTKSSNTSLKMQPAISFVSAAEHNASKYGQRFMTQEELLASCPPLPCNMPQATEECQNPSWSGVSFKIASDKAKTAGTGYWTYGNGQIACSHEKWIAYTQQERDIVNHYGRVNAPGSKKVSLPIW